MRAIEGPASSPISALDKALKRQRNSRGSWLVAAAFWIAVASGCGEGDPAPALPRGDWVYGDAPRFSAILASLESLQGTPAARLAAPLRERLRGCQEFFAHAPGGDPRALLGAADCVAPGQVPESIVALRGEGDLAFGFELAPGRRLNGRLTRQPTGALDIVASLDPPEAGSLAALFVPAKEPAGGIALAAADTLIHARVRPDSGLKIAELVSQGSQADRMFRLRSELFLGQILEGTWELAIYMPRDEHVTPPMALAIDHVLRPAAKAAMTKFVSELEATWPIHHSEQEIAGYEGACFHDLRLLPDLVPCWVLTEQSIVIGWNPLSIEVALSDTDESKDRVAEPFGASGGLRVRLDRLSEADRRLRQRLGGGEGGSQTDYLWDALRLEARNDGERLQLELSLELAGAS